MAEVKSNVDYIAEQLNTGKWREEWFNDNGGKDNAEGYESAEEVSVYEWLSDVLDIEYRVGSDNQFRSARVLVAFGGPNIWVDFGSGTVDGYWWGDEAHARIDQEVCDEFNEVLEELRSC